MQIPPFLRDESHWADLEVGDVIHKAQSQYYNVSTEHLLHKLAVEKSEFLEGQDVADISDITEIVCRRHFNGVDTGALCSWRHLSRGLAPCISITRC